MRRWYPFAPGVLVVLSLAGTPEAFAQEAASAESAQLETWFDRESGAGSAVRSGRY